MTVSFEEFFRGPTPGYGREPSAAETGSLGFLRSREEWITLVILAVALGAVISSVEDANWVREMPSLAAAGFGGLAAGWLLAQLPLRAGWGVPAGLAWGTLFVTGLLLDTLRLSDPAGPTGLAIRWSEMKLRFARWVEILVEGGISNDPLPFVALLVALVWIIGFVSAWSVVRWRNAWVALLPLGVLLLTNIAYLPGQPAFLFAIFLFAGVLLVTRLRVVRALAGWGSEDTIRPEALPAEVLRTASWAALVLLIAVWIVPTANNIGPLADRWAALIAPVTDRAERMGRLFVGVGSRPDSLHHRYGEVLPLKGRARLSPEPLLEVEAPGEGLLRALSYDTYAGQGWQVSETGGLPPSGSLEALAEGGLARTRLELRVPVSIEVTLLERVGDRVLLAAGDPLTTDLPASRRVGSTPADTVSLRPESRLRSGDTYTTVGTVSAAEIERLIASGTDYPAWVTGRYLQLPDDLPDAVREYALTLVSPGTQPYVAARLVEQHLRATFPVDLRVRAPPPLRDATAYFLFDAQRGYFDHHASAMVVLLRTLGIPARLAVGFVIDDAQFDEETRRYTLSELESWAWPEVYMAGLGWLDFNPTPSRPLIARPGDDAGVLQAFGLTDDGGIFRDVPFDEDADFEALLASLGADLGTGESSEIDFGSEDGVGTVARISGWILALSAVGLALIVGARLLWERPYRNLPPSTRRWGKLSRLAAWAGADTAPTRTPHETTREWREALWPRPLDAAPLAAAFARERYGRPGHEETSEKAEELDRLYVQLRNRFFRRLLALRRRRRSGAR
ncbi:MAG: transglutaminase domain-containing protein [Chloroflexi bacterium]|nr:transglutaminase domain-containing protein [Chloroflexota bacterium]